MIPLVKKRTIKDPSQDIFDTMPGAETSEATPQGLLRTTKPGEYKAPENRIRTDAQCRAAFDKLKTNHYSYVGDMLQIKAQFDGASPMDPKELLAKKLEYRANFNFGHLRTFIEKYLASEFTLIDSVSHLVDFRFSLGDRDLDKFLSKVFSIEWHRTFPEWEDFNINLDAMRKDRALYGIGLFIKEEPDCWEFTHVDALDFYVPPRVQLRKDFLSVFGIRKSWATEELWELYLDEGNPFWDKPALGKLLFEYSNEYRSDSSAEDAANWLKKLTESLRNHEMDYETQHDDVNLISLYVKEYDGKWTQLIISEQVQSQVSLGNALFFHDRQYKSVDDLIQLFPFTRGEKHIRGHQGLGERLENQCTAMNRLDNQLIDSTILSSTVLISSQSGRNRDSKQVRFNLGGITDIGQSQFVQNLAGANLASSVNTSQYLKGVVRENTGLEGFDIDEPSGRLKSVGELGLQVAEESVVNKPQVVFFYKQLDRFWRSLVRAQFYGEQNDMVKEWKARLKAALVKKFKNDEKSADALLGAIFDKGVKKDRYGLPLFLKITATRSASSGSKSADIVATQRMFQLASFMHEDARWKFLQRATAAYDDFEAVEEYFPEEDRPGNMTNGMQEAIKENPILKMGTQFPAVESDAHREHAPVHLKFMEEALQAWVDTQMDVVECDDTIRNVLPHFESHMVFLSQNPMDKAVFESLQAPRGQVLNLARKVQFDAAAAREAKMAAQQKEAEEAAFQESRMNPAGPEMTKIRADATLKEQELSLKNQRELRANDNVAIINAAKAEREVAIAEQVTIREAASKEILFKAKLDQILGRVSGQSK